MSGRPQAFEWQTAAPESQSPDGTTVHLVFSGDDAFSVRQASIIRR